MNYLLDRVPYIQTADRKISLRKSDAYKTIQCRICLHYSEILLIYIKIRYISIEQRLCVNIFCRNILQISALKGCSFLIISIYLNTYDHGSYIANKKVTIIY